MNSAEQSIASRIDNLMQNFLITVKQTTAKLPMIEHDDDWPSPCEQGAIDGDGFISWQPIKISDEVGFANVEEAIGYGIHDDIKQLFSRYYSEAIPAQCDAGTLELLFAWNKADFDRLQQTIIGHLLMKKRLKQAPTIFFAVTDEDDINLVIKNDNGEVWVEPIGCEPKTYIAANLAEFLASLTINYHPNN